MKNLLKSAFAILLLISSGSTVLAQNQFGNTVIEWEGIPVLECDLPPLIFEGHNAAGVTSFDYQNPGILPVFDFISVQTPLGMTPHYQSDIHPGEGYPMIFCCEGRKYRIFVRYELNYLGSGSTQIPNGATIFVRVVRLRGEC